MQEKLSSFHLSIFVYMIQVGVVFLVLPHLLALHFGTNGWLMVIIVSLVVTLNIVLIIVVYRLGAGQSIFEMLERSIPKLLLYPFYLLLICTWGMIGCLTTKLYVLVFQMIAFPTVHPMLFKLAVDVLAFFLVIKSIYNISKAATVFYFIISWMLLLLFLFYGEFQWARLTPFVFHDSSDPLKGLMNVFPAFLGYEIILLLIPYCDHRSKFGKSVLIGNAWTAVNYAYICIIAFGFFGYESLRHLQFPLLNLFAYIQLPFVQATENLLYGFLLFTTIITTVMYVWSAKEVVQRIIPSSGKLTAFAIFFVTYWIAFIPEVMSEVQQWLSYLSYIEIGIAFGLPVSLIVLLLLERRKGRLSNG